MIALLFIIVMLAAALTWSAPRGIAPAGGGGWRRRVGDVLSRACDAGSRRLLAAGRMVAACWRPALSATLARPAPARRWLGSWRGATPSLSGAENPGAWAVARAEVGAAPPGPDRTGAIGMVWTQAYAAAPERYFF